MYIYKCIGMGMWNRIPYITKTEAATFIYTASNNCSKKIRHFHEMCDSTCGSKHAVVVWYVLFCIRYTQEIQT